MEKLFLVEIDSLDNSQGCYASNDHFAEFFGLSKNRSSTIIKELEAKGFVSIFYQYKKGTKSIEKRIVKCTKKMCSENGQGYSENGQGYSENGQGYSENGQGYSENSEGINTLSNTLSNTDKDNVERSSTHKKIDTYKEIIDYLNQYAGTNYKHTSKATQRLIDARLNEGFTVDDFKVVIYKKCLDWKGDPKWETFLRTSTLFGNKFEIYLNQKEKQLNTNHIAMNVDMKVVSDNFFKDF
ncbi:MAG: conserved phage C-terminal domain-containing protein [Culicoidibacterales bacterium]